MLEAERMKYGPHKAKYSKSGGSEIGFGGFALEEAIKKKFFEQSQVIRKENDNACF